MSSSRPRRHLAAAAPAAALALLAAPSHAVVTSTWTVETFQQFDQGDATSAILTSLGELRPGWDTRRVALEGDGTWSALRLADGSALVGTDAGGAVYRVTGDAVDKVLAIDGALAVVALAQGPDGAVYAGAMPGDKVWRLDLKARKATVVATLPGVETVWSLAVAGDAVFAGTGPDGTLFEIKGGKPRAVFDTEDKRITALATTADGAVWLGTSERALVFRHGKDGTRAMADFAGNEITAIAAAGGGVVVAANELADSPGPGKSAQQVQDAERPNAPKGQQPKAPNVGTAPGADRDTSAAEAERKGERKGKGALFRVGDDGRLAQLHALTTTYYTSVVVDAAGVVYAGAADKGRIYQVGLDDSVATAFDVDERAVSKLLLDGASLVFATDDKAALYRATGRASQARYVSEVFDARGPSRFGKLTWQGTGKLTVETRSGNTARPGAGWSEWARPEQVGALGGGTTGGRIASPTGRYLQFRVAFGDADASLRRVSAFYIPQNEATVVEEVTADAPRDGTPTLKDPSSRARSPVVKLRWKTENPDGDDTTYALEVRRDGEAAWRALPTGVEPLTSTSWDWNTEAWPDGWYRVRVTSSDAVANSVDRALTSTATSALFAVDNARPTFDGLTVNVPRATVRVTDALGAITEAAFAVNDGRWQLATTSDGLFDDLAETVVVDLPRDLPRGTHTLTVRAADASGNVASTSTSFVVK
jgi:hypothetical protein